MNVLIRLVPVLLAVGVAGCAVPGGSGGGGGGASSTAACRARADEVYGRQNRADLYRADQYAAGGKDAPFGGGGHMNAPSLSARFAREQLVDNCLASRPGPAGPVQDAPEPAGAAVPKP